MKRLIFYAIYVFLFVLCAQVSNAQPVTCAYEFDNTTKEAKFTVGNVGRQDRVLYIFSDGNYIIRDGASENNQQTVTRKFRAAGNYEVRIHRIRKNTTIEDDQGVMVPFPVSAGCDSADPKVLGVTPLYDHLIVTTPWEVTADGWFYVIVSAYNPCPWALANQSISLNLSPGTDGLIAGIGTYYEIDINNSYSYKNSALTATTLTTDNKVQIGTIDANSRFTTFLKFRKKTPLLLSSVPNIATKSGVRIIANWLWYLNGDKTFLIARFAHDPNEISAQLAGSKVTLTISCENVGSGLARAVVMKTYLNPAIFDYTTISNMRCSHSGGHWGSYASGIHWTIRNDSLIIVMPEVYLEYPELSPNPNKTKGWVKFDVNIKSNVQVGTPILLQSEITFVSENYLLIPNILKSFWANLITFPTSKNPQNPTDPNWGFAAETVNNSAWVNNWYLPQLNTVASWGNSPIIINPPIATNDTILIAPASTSGKTDSGNDELETPNNYQIRLYPNPVRDVAFICFDVPDDNLPVTANLYDSQGRRVKVIEEQTVYNAGQQSLLMNLDDTPEGLYVLQIQIGDKVISKKVIKK